MSNDGLKLSGAIEVVCHDLDGRIIHSERKSNVVVTAGKNYLAAWVAASSQATPFMNYIACGTDNTAAAASQTALGAESFRKAGTLSSSGVVWQNVVTFLPGDGTGVISEVGLLSQSSGGTMLARQTISPFNKTASNSMTVTWQITIS